MRKQRILSMAMTIAASVLVLTACGNSTETLADIGTNGMASEAAWSTDAAMPTAKSYSEERTDYDATYSSEAEAIKNSMMIARNARLTVDVGNLEDFNTNLEKSVEEFGGYFTNSNIENYSSEWSSDRYAYYTFKIPADKLDSFLNKLDGETSVTQRSVQSEDISLQYVDNEARLSTLKTEKENLLKLMDSTTQVSDIIEIENRLSDIQYELDSAEQQKRLMEGRVKYSEVDLTAHEERNVEHPIQKAFEINFREKALEGIENAVQIFVGIITAIPAIIIITAFVVLFIWLLKLILVKIFRRKDGVRYMLMPVQIEDTRKIVKVENKEGTTIVDEVDNQI